MASDLPFRTKRDYESYLTRIAQYPKLNDEALKIIEQAVQGRYVLPCSVLGNYERSISGVIAEDPAKSRFYEPFSPGSRRRRSSRRMGGDAAKGAAGNHRRRAEPAYAKHHDFYTASYAPNCAKVGQCLRSGRQELFTLPVPLDDDDRSRADRIHEIGLAESKVSSEMEKLRRKARLRTRARHSSRTSDQPQILCDERRTS
jgi:uncharacterized protein (DUF885 family)